MLIVFYISKSVIIYWAMVKFLWKNLSIDKSEVNSLNKNTDFLNFSIFKMFLQIEYIEVTKYHIYNDSFHELMIKKNIQVYLRDI